MPMFARGSLYFSNAFKSSAGGTGKIFVSNMAGELPIRVEFKLSQKNSLICTLMLWLAIPRHRPEAFSTRLAQFRLYFSPLQTRLAKAWFRASRVLTETSPGSRYSNFRLALNGLKHLNRLHPAFDV